MATGPDVFSRMYSSRGKPVFVVRAYSRQVWSGKDESTADDIIRDYARLGQHARKHKLRIGATS